MTNKQTPSLEQHLKQISRGGAFFRTLHSLSQLAVLGVVLQVVLETWPIVAAQDDAGDSAGAVVAVVFMGCIRALPFLFLALGFRHLDNLFKAVRGAIEDLSTTV